VRLSGAMTTADVLAAFAGTTYRPELRDDRTGTAAGQPRS